MYSGLKSIAIVHEKEKAFLCNDCNEGFTTKHSLITHIQIHLRNPKPSKSSYFASEMYPHKCNMCESGFSTKLSLDQHIASFHEEKKQLTMEDTQSTDRQTDRQRQTDTQTDRQTHRQTDRQK